MRSPSWRLVLLGGFLASLFIAIGGTEIPRAPIAGDPYAKVAVLLAENHGLHLRDYLRLVGVALGLACWVAIRRHLTLGRAWQAALMWSLPVLFAYPIASGDLFNYLDHGWLVWHGHDPYTMPMGAVPGPFADLAGSWKGRTVGYPPLALLLSVPAALIGYWSPFAALLAARWMAVVGLVLVLWALPRIAERLGVDPVNAVWLACLSPVVFLHGVGGGHNDLLAIGVGLAGLAVVASRGTWGSALAAVLLVGLAASIKQPALVFALPIVALVKDVEPLPEARRRWAMLAGGMISAFLSSLMLVVLGWLTGWGLGWLTATGRPGPWSNSPLRYWQRVIDGPLQGLTWLPAFEKWQVAGLVATAVLGLTLIYWLIGRAEPTARSMFVFIVGGTVIALAFGSALYEWYLFYPLMVLGLIARDRGFRLAAALLAYMLYSFCAPSSGIPAAVAMIWLLTLCLVAWFALGPVLRRQCQATLAREPARLAA